MIWKVKKRCSSETELHNSYFNLEKHTSGVQKAACMEVFFESCQVICNLTWQSHITNSKRRKVTTVFFYHRLKGELQCCHFTERKSNKIQDSKEGENTTGTSAKIVLSEQILPG